MFDALIQIPDNVFLQYFIGFSIVSITIGWLLINLDGTARYPLPSPTRFGPIAIGVLRSGRAGAIQTALFNLWRLNLLEIKGTGNNVIVKNITTSQLPDNEVEKLLYQFAEKSRQSIDFFTDADLLDQIDAKLKPIYRGLEKLHLVRSRYQLGRGKVILWLILGFIALVGGIKLAFGFYYSTPVIGLILALGASLISGFFILQISHLSRLGYKYLKSISVQYSSLKKSLKSTDTSVNPAFGVAVFGMSAITGIAAFSMFESTFASIETDSNFGSSDDSSSDGGAGCGGGCGGG